MTASDTFMYTTAASVFAPTNTLPTIRAIHKSLHTQAEEKSTRLRTKVGASYRSLLGTADTIVTMKSDLISVQSFLQDMSTRTSAAVLKTKAEGLKGFERAEGTREASEVARLRVWEGAKGAFNGVLRGSEGMGAAQLGRGERLILGTKLVVLRRVVGMSFKNNGVVSEVVKRVLMTDDGRGQDGMRRKIARGIEKALEVVPEETEAARVNRDVVLKALAAYSLLTNAGAKDVLGHFLHVRGAAMAVALEINLEEKRELSAEDLMRALKLYTVTLLDVQSMVPYRITAELQSLKKTKLLNDPSLRALDILRLDINEKWFDDDLQVFTPFIKHDDLDSETVKTLLSSWAKAGSDVIISGLEKALATMNEFKAITTFRTLVLRHWIREGSRAKCINSEAMLDRLRDVINASLARVLDAKITKIHLVSSEIDSTLSFWVEKETDAVVNLWAPGAFTLDTSTSSDAGAGSYIVDVLGGVYGHNHAVSRALGRYHTWFLVIKDVWDVVESLQKQRWDNDYDEIEAEEIIEKRQQVLSKYDPRDLSDRLMSSLKIEFTTLEEKIVTLWEDRKTSPDSAGIAAYLLRVLRGLRNSLPNISSVKQFGLPLVPSLHDAIIRDVCMAPIKDFVLGPLEKRVVVSRGLWEGEEMQLPVQPSPETFRLLKGVAKRMAERGADLWTSVARRGVRERLVGLLKEGWREAVGAVETEVKNEEERKVKAEKETTDIGEEKKEEAENDQEDNKDEDKVDENQAVEDPETSAVRTRNLFIQWYFDILYLSHPLAKSESDEPFEDLQETLFEKTGLSESEKDKMGKSASNYWIKTRVLFGII